jgi:endonuclease/exonuclease/phosphatase family metal-dependent hydrolase
VAPGVGQWNDELDGIARHLHAAHVRRELVVGDFNATWGNRGFRAILSTGLVDGAAARGDALDMTWSQLSSPLPPLIRIDHVLTGPGVVVTTIHSRPGPGSDHRALLATVALLRRPP